MFFSRGSALLGKVKVRFGSHESGLGLSRLLPPLIFFSCLLEDSDATCPTNVGYSLVEFIF